MILYKPLHMLLLTIGELMEDGVKHLYLEALMLVCRKCLLPFFDVAHTRNTPTAARKATRAATESPE